MYKKSLKLLVLLVIMWFVSIVTIVRYPSFDMKRRLYSYITEETLPSTNENKEQFEEALFEFELLTEKNDNESNSAFHVWRTIPEKSKELIQTEKYSVLQDKDIPPGMNGKAVYIIDENLINNNFRWNLKHGLEKHAFNEFVSDLIPLNRTLPDVRDKWCKIQNYSTNLPEVSVVISFYNEAWSTLLRTVHSVLLRTPNDLLKEIIMIDDASQMSHLLKPLDDYVKKLPKVKLMRVIKRIGLIKARVVGAQAAKAPALVFLDSHCEVTEGWLEPLLDRIASNPTNVVSPLIDEIHKNTFEYLPEDLSLLKLGGFKWDLEFVWEQIPRDVYDKIQHIAAPIKTPIIPGGVFAIDKSFFEQLGYFDDGFDFWGYENLELSLKTWMCGGSMEIIPCSHVGHVIRKRTPYKKFQGSSKNRNAIRIAQVWLDGYAHFFYEQIGNNLGDFGNVKAQKELRRRLKCKSFDWYLKNVYPSMVIPKEFVAKGYILSLNNEMLCLSGDNSRNKVTDSVSLMKCRQLRGNQYWTYTTNGLIKYNGNMCLDYVVGIVVLNFCNNRAKSQVWLYKGTTQQIINMATIMCLKAAKFFRRLGVVLKNCSGSNHQKWAMENYNIENFNPELKIYAKNLPSRYLPEQNKTYTAWNSK